MKNQKLLLFFILSKILILLLVSAAAERLISYGGLFSHPSVIQSYGLPKFIYSFANFDGAHFLHIVQQGYHEFDQAFFPLFPLLIRLVSSLFSNNHLLIGLLVSNVSFAVGGILLYRLLTERIGQEKAFLTIVSLLLFPTSFFYQSVYTEGLFFLLVIASVRSFFKKDFFLSSFFSFLASLTRFAGVFLFISYLTLFLFEKKKLTRSLAAVLASPILGLVMYMAYLWKAYGDPLLFFSSQSAFGAGRSTKIILLPQVVYRYLKIFLLSDAGLGYFRAVLEFSVFIIVFSICIFYLYKALKKKDEFGIVIGTFSLLNIFVPTLTGTLLSIPRFALLSLSFFIVISSLKNRVYLISFFLFSSVLQVILFVYFIQGHFIS